MLENTFWDRANISDNRNLHLLLSLSSLSFFPLFSNEDFNAKLPRNSSLIKIAGGEGFVAY